MLATFTITPALASVIGSTITVECPTPRASIRGWSLHCRPDSRTSIMAAVAVMLAQLPVAGSLDDDGQPQEAHPARALLSDALAGNRHAIATIATAGQEAYKMPLAVANGIVEGDEGGHDSLPRWRAVLAGAMIQADCMSATLAGGDIWTLADYHAPSAMVRTYATPEVAPVATSEVAPAKGGKRKGGKRK